MRLIRLAARSAWNRRTTLALVVLCIALSTALLLGLERLRAQVREGFSNAVSGTDLIVGARGSSVQLLLSAVFRIGAPAHSISMEGLRELASHRAVDWVLPLSLGDSYEGFAVLGTTSEYFERFAHGDRRPLSFMQGRKFSGTLDGLYEAVLGAEVARRHGHRVGDRISLEHGTDAHAHSAHSAHTDRPFTIIGILEPTGTPVDRTVHVSLQAIEAIHLGWSGGAPIPGLQIPAEQARKFDLEPRQVTAALVGLKGRAAVFAVQRHVQAYAAEPLMAVLPGVALDELWTLIATGERALFAVSVLVTVVSLAGLAAVVLAGLGERRRELAVLRAVGASPRHLLGLVAAEAAWVTLAGVALGVCLLALAQWGAAGWLRGLLGIAPRWEAPSLNEGLLLLGVFAAGTLAGMVPAWRAARRSLIEGLDPAH